MRAPGETHFDVAIIGGGPAGAAAALTLAKRGRRALLIDATPADLDFQVGEGLPPAAMPLLYDLGLLESFLKDEHLPSYGNESVWGEPKPYIHDFIRDPNGHGYHLDRARFDRTLRRRAEEEGAALLQATRLFSFVREEGGYKLSLRAGAGAALEAHCRWLVDATGRAASVARQLGARRIQYDALVALVALYAPDSEAKDDDSFTLVESRPEGWWYSALLPRRRRVVALLTDADLPAARLAAKASGFEELCAQTTYVRARLEAGGYTRVTGPRGGPASTSRLECAFGPGWVAIGDAAMAFDPLSSQGIMTALYAGLRMGGALAAELEGRTGSVARESEIIARVHSVYRERRRMMYAAERRFSGQPFWQRRRSSLGSRIEGEGDVTNPGGME